MKRIDAPWLIFGPRLVTVVTALILTAGGPLRGQDSYNLGQLQEIESLILGRDCGGLWSYVQAHPALLQGGDPLARELSLFVERTQRGALDCFGSGPAVNQFAAAPAAQKLPY